MTELEKIAYTKMFIDKMAKGVNPIDDTKIKEDDLLNNKRISNCMIYVSDLLNQILENGGIGKIESIPFTITKDELSKYEYSETPILISEVCKKINELIKPGMKKIVHQDITSWLISKQAMIEEIDENGRKRRFPTAIGNKIGITTETKNGINGEYLAVLYNKKAQAVILKYMNEIIEMKNKK